MRWGMAIDLVKCSRCHACVAACRIEHFLPLRVTWVKLIASETEAVIFTALNLPFIPPEERR